ncbi:hypothetical protein AAY473_010181 [Plecturocebus cupreus]
MNMGQEEHGEDKDQALRRNWCVWSREDWRSIWISTTPDALVPLECCFGYASTQSPDGVSLCCPGWSAVAQSRLTAISASWVQMKSHSVAQAGLKQCNVSSLQPPHPMFSRNHASDSLLSLLNLGNHRTLFEYWAFYSPDSSDNVVLNLLGIAQKRYLPFHPSIPLLFRSHLLLLSKGI